MDKRLRKYYYAAIVNMFLWFPVISWIILPPQTSDPLVHKMVVGTVMAGGFLAMLLQHWTYYDIYCRKTRLTSSRPSQPGA